MTVLIWLYVVAVVAFNCKCGCSAPFVSLRSSAILTPSGSGVPLSCSYRSTSCSHCAKASSNLFSSSVGLRSFVCYPTEHVPVGMLNLWRSCLHVSRPLVLRRFCLQTVAAGPVHMLTRM